MVQLIVGVKGEGKTKKMLEHVHNILASTDGNVVYLDKSTQNMHELDNRVRLINVTEYRSRIQISLRFCMWHLLSGL